MGSSNEISLDTILPSVFVVRGVKAMLDSDLAALYGVETKRLNEQVKRNIKRFPQDFMFRLTKKEYEILRSQNATSSWGGRRTMPYAFTEHGVAMLSSVLNSDQAIEVNIAIMRAFLKMRQTLKETSDLQQSLDTMRAEYDEKFDLVFQALNRLITTKSHGRPIGFIWPEKPEKSRK